jgi:hypothetical protein
VFFSRLIIPAERLQCYFKHFSYISDAWILRWFQITCLYNHLVQVNCYFYDLFFCLCIITYQDPVLQRYFSSTFLRTNSVFLSQQISISQISAKQTNFYPCLTIGIIVNCYVYVWTNIRFCRVCSLSNGFFSRNRKL